MTIGHDSISALCSDSLSLGEVPPAERLRGRRARARAAAAPAACARVF